MDHISGKAVSRRFLKGQRELSTTITHDKINLVYAYG